MNAFIAGVLCFVYLVLVNGVAAGAQTFTLSLSSPPGCEVQSVNGTYVCDNDGSGGNFVDSFRSVAVQGLDGAPNIVNEIWLFFNGLALVTGLVLVITYFIGLIFGGSG